MSRYFLQGTPLGELEKIMSKTPRLRSPGMTILTDPFSHVAEGTVPSAKSLCESTVPYRDALIYVSDWTSSW